MTLLQWAGRLSSPQWTEGMETGSSFFRTVRVTCSCSSHTSLHQILAILLLGPGSFFTPGSNGLCQVKTKTAWCPRQPCSSLYSPPIKRFCHSLWVFGFVPWGEGSGSGHSDDLGKGLRLSVQIKATHPFHRLLFPRCRANCCWRCGIGTQRPPRGQGSRFMKTPSIQRMLAIRQPGAGWLRPTSGVGLEEEAESGA